MSTDGSFMAVANRQQLLRQLFGGRPCCDHCNNLEGDPDGHDYGDLSAHDGPCAECAAESECNHPPLPVDEREIVELLADLARLEHSGDFDPAPVLLGPYTAYVLIAVLQLAWRHPELSPHHKQIIEDIARPLSTLFGPPLSDSIELGWDPAYDQERPIR